MQKNVERKAGKGGQREKQNRKRTKVFQEYRILLSDDAGLVYNHIL